MQNALKFFDPSSLLIASTRYYLGRMSIAVHDHVERLARAWEHIPTQDREIILRDIRLEIEMDNTLRKNGHGPLGMDMDRKTWVEFYDAHA